jgi:hypothetical protein
MRRQKTWCARGSGAESSLGVRWRKVLHQTGSLAKWLVQSSRKASSVDGGAGPQVLTTGATDASAHGAGDGCSSARLTSFWGSAAEWGSG